MFATYLSGLINCCIISLALNLNDTLTKRVVIRLHRGVNWSLCCWI